jgi:hypothetical protein
LPLTPLQKHSVLPQTPIQSNEKGSKMRREGKRVAEGREKKRKGGKKEGKGDYRLCPNM